MKKAFTIAVAVFASLTLIVGVTALAASDYGTSGDPLITLSYLNDVLRPELDAEFDSMLGEKSGELKDELEAAVKELEEKYANSSAGGTMSTYAVVTIENGQKLTGAVGTEIMLRVGSAKVSSPASPGLIDTTTGGVLESGNQLVKNHLYMVTIDGRAIVSTAHTLVIVRGPYTIS